MRILLVAKGRFSMEPGGLNRYVDQFVPALCEAGHDVVTLFGSTNRSHEKSPIARCWSMFSRVRRQTEEFDLVNAHFALYALPALLGLGRKRPPVVVHFHGPWAMESRIGSPRRWLANRTKYHIERWVYRRATRFVVLSDHFAQLLSEAYAVPRERIQVILPGVDRERFHPALANGEIDESQDLTAICVRRLERRMGIEDALVAWRQARRPGRLLIVGEGSFGAELRRLAEGIRGVEFLGRVADGDLVRLLQTSDLAVVPSRDLEGFGLAAAEALSCGIPVAVSNLGVLPEVVGPELQELVFEPGDVQHLAAIFRSYQRTSTLTEAALRQAGNYRWSDCVARHELLFTEARRRTVSLTFVDHCAVPSGAEISLIGLVRAIQASEDASDFDLGFAFGEPGEIVGEAKLLGVPVAVRGPTARKGRIRIQLAETAADLAREAWSVRQTLNAELLKHRTAAVYFNTIRAFVVARPLLPKRVTVVVHVRDRLSRDMLSAAKLFACQIALRRADGVIANSGATRRTLPGQWKASAEVIRSPLRREFATAADPPEHPLTIVVLGRISPWKGQAMAITAFASSGLAERKEATLHIVGAPLFGEFEYAERVENMARTTNGVFTHGHETDVVSLVEQLGVNVLVHSSTRPEPLGMVIAEGLALGLLVIAPAEGGPAEVIEDGVNGLLYEPNSADSLAAAMVRAGSADLDRFRPAAKASLGEFEPSVVAAKTNLMIGRLIRDKGKRQRASQGDHL